MRIAGVAGVAAAVVVAVVVLTFADGASAQFNRQPKSANFFWLNFNLNEMNELNDGVPVGADWFTALIIQFVVFVKRLTIIGSNDN